ncbi:unnamed protein product [Prunus armeniaca]
MDPIDGITQGLTISLAISNAEAVDVVGLDDLDGLKATRFLLVGWLLTIKDYHKDSLVGTMKRTWHTKEEFSSVTLEDSKRILFSFKSDLDCKRVMRLDHVGSGCEFKNSGVIDKEQCCRWKTSIKDVFHIRVPNGLTRRILGFGEELHSQKLASGSHVSPVGTVHSHYVAFAAKKDISLGSYDTLHRVSEGSLPKKIRKEILGAQTKDVVPDNMPYECTSTTHNVNSLPPSCHEGSSSFGKRRFKRMRGERPRGC